MGKALIGNEKAWQGVTAKRKGIAKNRSEMKGGKMKYSLNCIGQEPTRAHFDDAGIDLKLPHGLFLRSGEQTVVDLGVSVQIPIGYFGKLESKSGLMVNHGIICMGGVIDSSFRGTIKVRMWNTADEDYRFEKGDKLVQLVIIPVLLTDLVKVDRLDNSESGRDTAGFGSTGR